MKVSREQVAENRRLILDASARLFRERGIDGVTVAEIMGAAGLTHGAFYGHFASKEDLVAQACAHALPAAGDGVTLAGYLAAYLAPDHRDDHGGGCVFAALGSEAVRGGPAMRRTLTEAVRRQVDRLAETAPGRNPAQRRQAAITAWSAMVGAVTLARLVDDGDLSDEILAATKAGLTA